MVNPRITIVTPSFNRKKYLEKTILSVIDQNYPNLEYIIIDGGSIDGSVDIIRKYADRLAYWCSEPDGGMYHALNKGFALGTGDIMGWLNSDDSYFPWTLSVVASVMDQFPNVEWITSLLPSVINEGGIPYKVRRVKGYSKKYFQKGFYISDPCSGLFGFIQQESTFWKRSLFESVGNMLDINYRFAGDFDLWTRFMDQVELYGIDCQLGAFRAHGNQLTSQYMREYLVEANTSLCKNGKKPRLPLERWLRFNNVPEHWPFRLFPSLGMLQSVSNIRWQKLKKCWEIHNEWI